MVADNREVALLQVRRLRLRKKKKQGLASALNRSSSVVGEGGETSEGGSDYQVYCCNDLYSKMPVGDARTRARVVVVVVASWTV